MFNAHQVARVREVNNRFADQPLNFVLRTVADGKNGHVDNLTFLVGEQRVMFPVRLEPRQYLVSEGGGKGVVCEANWNPLRTVQASLAAPILPTGVSQIRFGCEAAGEPQPHVEIQFETRGVPRPAGSSGR